MKILRIGLFLLPFILIGCSSFQEDWELARSKDTSSQYQSFLDQYGNSDHPEIEQARARQAYINSLHEKLSSLSVGMPLTQVQEIIEVHDLKPIYPSWLEGLEKTIELGRSYGTKLDYTVAACNTDDLRKLNTQKKIRDNCNIIKISSYEQADKVIEDARKDVVYKSVGRDYTLKFDSEKNFADWDSKLNFDTH